VKRKDGTTEDGRRRSFLEEKKIVPGRKDGKTKRRSRKISFESNGIG